MFHVLAILVLAFLDVRAFASLSERLVPKSGIIQSPGVYYIANDRITSKDVNIDILSDDVVLNLNGKRLITRVANSAIAVTTGVRFNGKRRIQVLNGKITGAFFGIQAVLSDDLRGENVDFSGNTYIGINFSGSRAKILNCTFANLGGYAKEAYSVGVSSSEAKDALISGNSFTNLYRQPNAPSALTGEGVGVLLSHGTQGCKIVENIFHNDRIQPHTYGIWAVGRGHTISQNVFRNHDHGMIIGEETVAEANYLKTDPSLPKSIAIGGPKGRSIGNKISGYVTAITPPIESIDDDIQK